MSKWEKASETDECIKLRRKIWCYRSACDHKDFDTEPEAQEYKAKMGGGGTIESTFLEKRESKPKENSKVPKISRKTAIEHGLMLGAHLFKKNGW